MKRANSPRGSVRRRWRSRPLLSLAIRAATILVPAAGGAAVAVGVGRAVPQPEGPPVVAWWLGLFLTCVVTSVLIERLARRFLPLAMLLRLSLVFPDRAPSRFALARRYGNPRVLEERIRVARERGVDDDPARAAGEILSLVAALSAHDRKTRGHSERVRAFTDLIASELKLTEDERDHLRWATLLHDIGKLRVPARILNKPGKPEHGEWELLKRHPSAGARIAKPLLPWLGEWGATIEQHHERFDGGGYPCGFARNDICLGARIVSVADSFEVMTAARSYKRPSSVPAARAELARCAGLQFDPDVVRAFFSISIGRLWWTVGPAAWVAVTPFLGWLQRAGGQVATAAQGAAVVAVVGLSGAVGLPAATQARGVTEALPIASVGTGSSTIAPSASPAQTGPGHAKPGGGSGGGDQTSGTDPGGAVGGSGGGTPGGGTGTPVSDLVATVTKVVDQATGTVSDAASGTTDTVVEATKDATGGLVP